ncbi:MAG: ABC transporter ATP-binding protein, partial [Gammaproteobacteria bacterium]
KMKYALAQESGQLLEVLVNRPQSAMKVLQQANFEGASLFGKHIHLLTQDIESSIQQLKQLFNQYSIELIRYRPLPITLEDVFVYRVLALEKQAQS